MDERNNEADKLDEVLLPGFRFHPTDEELVGFYLKRKIQQRPLSIELIKQLDIYKYDPWDLPKLATTGEREWYFYCPRDRKYRNSARPNRVTGAGFWKATGTDRPIYSSEGTKCIGLKKSLVFYKGKAAKGIKTDWMMHEFRLPSLTDSMPSKRFTDHKNNIPANDSWAICRIFKKTNSSAQRALSHSWVSPLPETNTNASDLHAKNPYNNTHFGSENMSILTAAKTSTAPLHFNYNDDLQHSSTASTTTTSSASFSPLDYASYKALNSIPNKLPPQLPMSAGELTTASFMFSPFETSCTTAASKCNIDVSSMLLNMSSSMLGDFGKAGSECIDFGGSQEQQQCSGFSTSGLSHHQMQVNINSGDHENVYVRNQNVMHHLDDQWDGSVRSLGFPFSLPMSLGEAWKASSLWDSSSCPSEMSTIVSTKCYT